MPGRVGWCAVELGNSSFCIANLTGVALQVGTQRKAKRDSARPARRVESDLLDFEDQAGTDSRESVHA